jgi:hypothetical protein
MNLLELIESNYDVLLRGSETRSSCGWALPVRLATKRRVRPPRLGRAESPPAGARTVCGYEIWE